MWSYMLETKRLTPGDTDRLINSPMRCSPRRGYDLTQLSRQAQLWVSSEIHTTDTPPVHDIIHRQRVRFSHLIHSQYGLIRMIPIVNLPLVALGSQSHSCQTEDGKGCDADSLHLAEKILCSSCLWAVHKTTETLRPIFAWYRVGKKANKQD